MKNSGYVVLRLYGHSKDKDGNVIRKTGKNQSRTSVIKVDSYHPNKYDALQRRRDLWDNPYMKCEVSIRKVEGYA